jgi:hypothetical protein
MKALQQGDLVSSETLTEPCEQGQAVLLTDLAVVRRLVEWRLGTCTCQAKAS